MQWDRSKAFVLSLSFAVLLFCSAASSVWPEEANSGTQPLPPLPMPSLPGFADNWATLRQLVSDWGTDSEALLNELEKSQAIAEELTNFLTESNRRSKMLESLLESERLKSGLEIDRQKKRADLWKAGAIAGCTAAAIAGLMAALF